MDFGMILSDNDLNNSVPNYDTRKQKVTVDLNPSISHAAILHKDAGTVLTSSTVGAQVVETLWTMQHNMPFKPRVEGFFTVTSIPNDRHCEAVVGTYQKTLLWITVNAIGYGTEKVEMKVDDFNISLVHTAVCGGSGFVGCGNLLKYDFRYLITNQPALA